MVALSVSCDSKNYNLLLILCDTFFFCSSTENIHSVFIAWPYCYKDGRRHISSAGNNNEGRARPN